MGLIKQRVQNYQDRRADWEQKRIKRENAKIASLQSASAREAARHTVDLERAKRKSALEKEKLELQRLKNERVALKQAVGSRTSSLLSIIRSSPKRAAPSTQKKRKKRTTAAKKRSFTINY